MKLLAALLAPLLAVLPMGAATPEPKVYASHLMVDQDVVVCSRITGILEEVYVDRGSAVTVLVTMTAGTMFAIWLGELITEQGIGNGLSIIIFSGIVAQAPGNLFRLNANILPA